MDNTQNTEVKDPQNQPPALKELKVNFNNQIDISPIAFKFKKKPDVEEAGVTIEGTTRPTLELDLPLLSFEGILTILAAEGNDKEKELLREAINDVIIARARQIVNDDENITSDSFPYSELTWEHIANLPKAERRGGGISKETWEGFVKDYVEIMPAAANKKLDAVQRAAKVFAKKFADVKSDKKVLSLLRDQLTIYVNHSPNVEQFEECVSFLVNKADTLINQENSSLLESL